jgi:2-dehydropantoate 2-reductase
VTFLVRPRRAEELAESGLRIRSRLGDVTISNPPTILRENVTSAFDLVLLSCKAYDLAGAIASFAPAVGSETVVLPLLNGIRHLDILDEKFGQDRVLGGQCFIASTLNEDREIVHLNETHAISFGERDGSISDRVMAIDRLMEGARFDHRASPNIVLDMWEKWVFLATLAGSTCLFRASVGDISAAPGGTDFILGVPVDCSSCGVCAERILFEAHSSGAYRDRLATHSLDAS